MSVIGNVVSSGAAYHECDYRTSDNMKVEVRLNGGLLEASCPLIYRQKNAIKRPGALRLLQVGQQLAA